MCSAIGAFMVSDFSLGVILQRPIAVANEAWRGTPRLDRLLRFSLSRRRRASALQEMLAERYDTVRFAKAIPISSTVTMMHSQENQSPKRA